MYKIYLGFICVFIINSVEGRSPIKCAAGEVSYGWFCSPRECPNGYSLSTNGNKCEPICEDGCDDEHGVCVAPGKCNCTEGYSMSESNKCKPICEGGCTNGYCLYPNWCSCDAGYKKHIDGMNNNCVADCPNGCTDNSYCISPGECSCISGYTITDEGICQEYVKPSDDNE